MQATAPAKSIPIPRKHNMPTLLAAESLSVNLLADRYPTLMSWTNCHHIVTIAALSSRYSYTAHHRTRAGSQIKSSLVPLVRRPARLKHSLGMMITIR
jgi:uncharacterized protein YifN (PemK superfamily)